MNKYLVTFYLDSFDEAFMSLIPDHRAMINDLLTNNVIETYAINSERTKGWATFNAEDEETVIAHIDQFPIRSYIHYEIEKLFIFDNAMALLPRFILN